MKFANKLSVLLILLITGYSSIIYSQSEWVLKSTGCNLLSVYFTNEMTGWVVGDSGTVLATLDGGSNWHCVTSGTTQSLQSLYFINDLTGWAAGTGGVVIKTTNGGANWVSLSSGTTNTINTIYFPTLDTGFFSGNFPLGTKKTTNGGTSWFLGGDPFGSSLYFSSGSTGMTTNSSGYLAKTSTGGAMWTAISGPGNPNNQYAMSFVNTTTGWTAGAGNQVFKTTNAGSSWAVQTNSATSSATFYGIDFPDDMHGYAAGYSGYFAGDSAVISSTTNGGTTWVSQKIGTKKPLRDVDFVDAMTGWAVGDEGVILYTSNGGSTWTNQLVQYSSPLLQTYSVNDIHFRNSMTGWSVGYFGIVNKTTDGGSNWTSSYSASYNWLYSIYFPNENDTGWACGRSGTIEKTENGGLNWIVQTTSTPQHLNCIVVDKYLGNSVKTGWCVGNYGTILAPDTTGYSWGTQYSGTTNDLNSVFVFDDYNAIVCGNAGTILKTTDSGANWVAKTSGTAEDLKSIYFINSSTGYVCGSSGTIKITTDGGGTWSAQTSGTTSMLYSIDFEETMVENGYAVGENGTIVETTNGGLTWYNQSSGSTTPIYAVFAKDFLTSAPFGPIVRYVGKFARYGVKKAATALPVELTSFNSSVSNNNVNLTWVTSGELNNRGFEIERRSLANNWSNIGFVQGYGTIQEPRNYSFLDRNLNSGTYKYRLKQIDFNGNYKFYDLSNEIVIGEPDRFELKQNYPNPFNPKTIIKYSVSEFSTVKLVVYDITGKEIKTLFEGNLNPGNYSAEFDGSNLSSGIYFYNLRIGSMNQTKKMILAK